MENYGFLSGSVLSVNMKF